MTTGSACWLGAVLRVIPTCCNADRDLPRPGERGSFRPCRSMNGLPVARSRFVADRPISQSNPKGSSLKRFTLAAVAAVSLLVAAPAWATPQKLRVVGKASAAGDFAVAAADATVKHPRAIYVRVL